MAGSAAMPMIGIMRITAIVLAFAAAVVLSSASAPAFSGSEQEQAREAVQSGQARSLKDILRGLGGQVDGRVLDAQLDDVGGRWIYRIKVLGRDGRVKILGVDALSGQVLEVR
jgi:uncharacterized membrane protein YkoI